MMKRQSQLRRIRSGTTLIEVLAGLVILATLLVSVAIARGRFLRQWADADRTIKISKSIDHQLTLWFAGPPQAVPLSSQGPLEQMPNYMWRTHVVHDTSAASVGAIVVRLEVYDRRTGVLSVPALDFLLHNFTPVNATPQKAPKP